MFAVTSLFRDSVILALIVEKVRWTISLLLWTAVLVSVVSGMVLLVSQVAGILSPQHLLPDPSAILVVLALTLATPVLAAAAYYTQPKGSWQKFQEFLR